MTINAIWKRQTRIKASKAEILRNKRAMQEQILRNGILRNGILRNGILRNGRILAMHALATIAEKK